MILGVEDVYDPDTGEQWRVPAGGDYYWRRGNEIFITQTPTPPVHDPELKELLIDD